MCGRPCTALSTRLHLTSANQFSPVHHLHPKPVQDGSYGLLAPLIDCDSFRASIRPPRPRRDPPGSVLLRLESGDESVKANHFDGEDTMSASLSQWCARIGPALLMSHVSGGLSGGSRTCFAHEHGTAARPSAHPPAAGVLYAAAGSDPFELLDRGVAAAAHLSGGRAGRRACWPAGRCVTVVTIASCCSQRMAPWETGLATLSISRLTVATCCPPGRLLPAAVGQAGPRVAGRVWVVLMGCHVYR